MGLLTPRFLPQANLSLTAPAQLMLLPRVPPPCPWAVRKAQWAAPLPRAFGKLAARTPVKSTQCWRVAGDIKSEARCPTRSVSQEWAGWWGSELSTTDMQGWEYHC